MQLRVTYPTICQLDQCGALEFPPTLTAVEFLQPTALANAFARGNRLSVGDVAYDSEKHAAIVRFQRLCSVCLTGLRAATDSRSPFRTSGSFPDTHVRRAIRS